MPVVRQRMVFDIARGIKAFLNFEAGATRGAVPEFGRPPEHAPAKRSAKTGENNGRLTMDEIKAVRKDIASFYLIGQGLEVGALHQPLETPSEALVKYVDRMSVEQLRKQYPELSKYKLVPVDVIDDGEVLATVDDGSVDFVIANHMMEHCQNPIGTLQNHLRVIKPGGVLYLAVPDMRYTFDKDRPVTDLEHLLEDYREGPAHSREGHFEEYTRLVEKPPEERVADRARELSEMDFSIHYHVWTQKEFLQMLHHCQDELEFPFEIELFQKNDMELICVLRKSKVRANVDPAVDAEFEKRGPWVTKFVVDGGEYGGDFDAARDERVDWFFEHVPDTKRVMELGSLEGGHTFNLASRPQVEHVLGVEGRKTNVEKAEFARDLLKVENAEFVTANLEETDLSTFGEFDAVFCSGLLYHLPEPWKLIEQISRVSPSVFIWTHYAKEEAANATRNGVKGMTYQEFGLEDPLSGMSPDSFWPTLDGLQEMLKEHGFENITLIKDEPEHPHGGPAITLAASTP